MEYLHLIMNEKKRDLVQRVARNDPTLTELTEIMNVDADVLLALGHALIGNTHLSNLMLENLVLTEEAAHALTRGMAQSKIAYLTLEGNCQGNPPQSQGSICDIFYHGIQASTTIQKFYFNQSLTDDPGNAWRDALLGITSMKFILSENNWHGYVQAFSHVLSRTTVLRSLDVDLCEGVELDDMTILAHGFHQNTSFTSLRLSDYSNNVRSVQHLLAQGLNPNSAITTLFIMNCNFDDSCVELLVDHWLPNCPMEELYLKRNKIGPTGALRLTQAVANYYPSVLRLGMSCNYDIGYEGLRLIGNELPNLQNLTYLNLDRCINWEDRAQTTAHQQAGQALLDGIKRNLSITELNLDQNDFPRVVLDEIYFYVALNATGRYLLVDEDGHGLPPFVWCRVFERCQSEPHLFWRPNFSTSLVYFYLREQPALVQSRPTLKRKIQS